METQEGIEIMAEVCFDRLEDVTLLQLLRRGWVSPEFIVKHRERIMALDLPENLRDKYDKKLPEWINFFESRTV